MSTAGLVEAEQPSAFWRCASACCCYRIEDRDMSNDWMLSPLGLPPSLFERLVMCHCSAQEKKPGGIEFDEALRGLAGVTLQDGEHSTGGSLQSLRYATYDPTTRTAVLKVFGGFGQPAGTGSWTEPLSVLWLIAMNAARCGNYTYLFTFAEDKRSADIDITGNPCFLCCCFCLPNWCSIPRSLVSFSMRQTSASQDGSEWERLSSSRGGEPTLTYHLRTVYNVDGTKGPFFDRLAKAPKQMMITF